MVTVGNTRLIVGDKKTVSGFWAPRLATTSLTGHVHYDLTPEIPPSSSSARISSVPPPHGSVLQLTGDLNATTTVDVLAPKQFKSMTWNGAAVHTTLSPIGSLRGNVAFPAKVAVVSVPVLANLEWSCAYSLPELDAALDDST